MLLLLEVVLLELQLFKSVAQWLLSLSSTGHLNLVYFFDLAGHFKVRRIIVIAYCRLPLASVNKELGLGLAQTFLRFDAFELIMNTTNSLPSYRSV
jgi:hypothetical protein